MSWIKPELRLNAPINTVRNTDSLNAGEASSSVLTAQRPNLESAVGHPLKLLQRRTDHL